MGMRTVQDFIEDMVSDCKSLQQILIVAQSTRWRNHVSEVKEEYEKLMQSFKNEKDNNNN